MKGRLNLIIILTALIFVNAGLLFAQTDETSSPVNTVIDNTVADSSHIMPSPEASINASQQSPQQQNSQPTEVYPPAGNITPQSSFEGFRPAQPAVTPEIGQNTEPVTQNSYSVSSVEEATPEALSHGAENALIISSSPVNGEIKLSSAPAKGDAVTTSADAVKISSETAKAPKYDYDNLGFEASGLVLMPTAYRGNGINQIGLSLDLNAAYYIGRLYGKNDYEWSKEDKNYLDRIGLWMLMADGKMLVQTETDWLPAISAGVMGMMTLRDSSQPTLGSGSQSMEVDANAFNGHGGGYIVASKRFYKKRFLATLGYSYGTIGNMVPMLSEFLSKESMVLNGMPDAEPKSNNLFFGGLFFLLTPSWPIGVEFMIPQGMPMSPKLINIHLGTLLKMNFEVSYLTYEGGWDLLGMIQFRYTFYPKW